LNPAYFAYWGKAKPAAADQAGWHLLPYHCLDVAAAGVIYLQKATHVRQLFQDRLKLSEKDLLDWVAFWLAIHDLGKFATAFQGQRSDIVRHLQKREVTHSYSIRHDSLGMLFWKAVLSDLALQQEWFGPDGTYLIDGMDHWARAVTGHHGQPPDESVTNLAPHFHRLTDEPAAIAFALQMKDRFLSGIDFTQGCFANPKDFLRESRLLSWWVAGVSVLADWVGSNQDHFAYVSETMPLNDYWADALIKAERAMSEVGVLPVDIKGALGFEELFPEIATPSPLQVWATQTSIQAAPQIHLLEDVTGAGKTEAAMTLTHRLMSEGAADGFYIGLPTMATANAMYGRLSGFYMRRFDGLASITLASGQRDLVAAFAESVLPPGAPEADAAQQDETATARCTAWLADHNKRALLAPAGVGTIDQALMAALQGKHQSLRLLGLFRKVLVVDEVHACDPYMQGVLERLLECHAQAGGSAILLSATLPQVMKQSLLDAFSKGAGSDAPEVTASGYPLVTSWAATQPDQLLEEEVATRPDVSRTVTTRYLNEVSEVVNGIKAALALGHCVCWMRNTVVDALEAHAMFAENMPADKLTLFHARFTLSDRLDTEHFILERFGKHSTPDQRCGRLVIATQVAEQSLDADWDLVVSDLAPIDRLIQRAGRLQRHRRDANGERLADDTQADGRGTPTLWVLGPAWAIEPGADWFKSAFPKSSKVYRHHGQLWLTAQQLQSGQFSMPVDARRLIEGVFGADLNFPAGLQSLADGVDGEEMSEASLAQQNSIKLNVGYKRGSVDWWADAKTPSRIGELSVNVLLARWCGGRLKPWIEHDDVRHAWAYSTVRVPQRLIAATADLDDPAEQAELERVKESLPDKGKWSVLLPLKELGPCFEGVALAQWGKRQVKRRWTYDPQFGLKVAG
jgi:CRISPR-associated endonuclease/helicase Cas3